jgi:hypothetical protein
VHLTIKQLYIRSFDLDHLDLYWETQDTRVGLGTAAPDILDYEFYILRSGDSPEGPYTQIAGPLRDQYLIRDTNVSLLHKWRQYYYKIRVVHKPSGKEETFGPTASSTPEPNLEAAEIIRAEDLLFRNYVGRKCWLFIARTFGPRCTCYDMTLKRKTVSNHRPCFGTGFLGGFLPPIEVYVQIDPSGKNVKRTSLQEVQQYDTMGRMIAFPPVSPDDIIVESENKRWRVISVNSTERLRAPVHHELALHQIPKGDIEYDLPINVTPQSIFMPASEGNFNNPHHLESGEDYGDILAAFGNPRGSLRRAD